MASRDGPDWGGERMKKDSQVHTQISGIDGLETLQEKSEHPKLGMFVIWS